MTSVCKLKKNEKKLFEFTTIYKVTHEIIQSTALIFQIKIMIVISK